MEIRNAFDDKLSYAGIPKFDDKFKITKNEYGENGMQKIKGFLMHGQNLVVVGLNNYRLCAEIAQLKMISTQTASIRFVSHNTMLVHYADALIEQYRDFDVIVITNIIDNDMDVKKRQVCSFLETMLAQGKQFLLGAPTPEDMQGAFLYCWGLIESSVFDVLKMPSSKKR